MAALQNFDPGAYQAEAIRQQALQFDRARHEAQLRAFIERAWADFRP
jgi:hypothetical protein